MIDQVILEVFSDFLFYFRMTQLLNSFIQQDRLENAYIMNRPVNLRFVENVLSRYLQEDAFQESHFTPREAYKSSRTLG